jgi:hypothetical protein
MEWENFDPIKIKKYQILALKMTKKDPYAALRYKEFNTFIVAFCYGFRLVHAFIVIEWQVYSITKDPLSGSIGLMEVIPAFSMALFAGHIVDQRKRKDCC